MVRQINKLPESPKNSAKSGSVPDDAAPTVRAGNLIVLTGPSGVGKGTLTEKLLADVPRLKKSVSVTTRTRRPQETEGVDYFFLTREEFEQQKPELLEWAEFADNCYGTPERWVDEQLELGNDVLLEIEVQGAHQIMRKRPQSLLIFISPPSIEALELRLRKRATEDEAKIRKRLEKAKIELTQKNDFHYEVINVDIDEAVNNLRHIVYAERCRIRK